MLFSLCPCIPRILKKIEVVSFLFILFSECNAYDVTFFFIMPFPALCTHRPFYYTLPCPLYTPPFLLYASLPFVHTALFIMPFPALCTHRPLYAPPFEVICKLQLPRGWIQHQISFPTVYYNGYSMLPVFYLFFLTSDKVDELCLIWLNFGWSFFSFLWLWRQIKTDVRYIIVFWSRML